MRWHNNLLGQRLTWVRKENVNLAIYHIVECPFSLLCVNEFEVWANSRSANWIPTKFISFMMRLCMGARVRRPSVYSTAHADYIVLRRTAFNVSGNDVLLRGKWKTHRNFCHSFASYFFVFTSVVIINAVRWALFKSSSQFAACLIRTHLFILLFIEQLLTHWKSKWAFA